MILAALSATFLLFAGVWVLLVIGTGIAAHARGRDAFGWALLAVLLTPFLALLLLIAFPAQPRGGTRACPQCAERVARIAIVCRYCGYDLPLYRPPIPRRVAIAIIFVAVVAIGMGINKFDESTTKPVRQEPTSQVVRQGPPTSQVVREIATPSPAQSPEEKRGRVTGYSSSSTPQVVTDISDQIAQPTPVPRPRPRP
jgi:hypothetical protein